jgi:hypothetical protein
VPGTCNSPVTRQHALDERRAVMRAFAANGRDLTADVCEEHLALVDAFDFDLALLAGLEVEAGEAFELVLLGHSGW